jgi:hypothetical protein
MHAKQLKKVFLLVLSILSTSAVFAQDTMLVNPKARAVPPYAFVLYSTPTHWSQSMMGFTLAYQLENGSNVVLETEGLFGYNPRFYRFNDFDLDTSSRVRIGFLLQNRLSFAFRTPWGVYSKSFSGKYLGLRFERGSGLEVKETQTLRSFDFVQRSRPLRYHEMSLLIGGSRALRYNSILEAELGIGYMLSQSNNTEIGHRLVGANSVANGVMGSARIRIGFGLGKSFTREKTERRLDKFGLGLDFTAAIKNGIVLYTYIPVGQNNLLTINGTYLHTDEEDFIKTNMSNTTMTVGLGVGYLYFLNKDGRRMGNYLGGKFEKRYSSVGVLETVGIAAGTYSFYPNLFTFKFGHLNSLGRDYLIDVFIKSGITVNTKSNLNIHDFVENSTGFYTSVGLTLGIFK